MTSREWVALGSVKILDAIVAIPPSTQDRHSSWLEAWFRRSCQHYLPWFYWRQLFFVYRRGNPSGKRAGRSSFNQGRVGQGGRKFAVYKFRSMAKDAESRFHEVRHHNQITDGPIFKLKNDPELRESDNSCDERVLTNCRSSLMFSRER